VCPSGQGGRSIYNEDKKEILEAARKHGYRLLVDNAKIASFIRKRLTKL